MVFEYDIDCKSSLFLDEQAEFNNFTMQAGLMTWFGALISTMSLILATQPIAHQVFVSPISASTRG